jgi:hypothetical protein
MLVLSDLQKLCDACEAWATPHRVPDFHAIWPLVDGDPEVRGQVAFIEEHNTGYDGLLYRWLFMIKGKDGETEQFQADLLPDMIRTEN